MVAKETCGKDSELLHARRRTGKRVAVYCRVSTADELQEGSFELQKNYYRKRIEADPVLTLAGIYGDQGRSGCSIEARPEFRRLLKDCEEGKIDLILTKSISRFARSLADCISAIRRLQELGIPVIFERENLNTMEMTGELFLCILAALAQEESNSIARNIKWSRKKWNEMGKPYGQVSYGYRAEKEDHAWYVEESEAKRVRLAFQMAAQGQNYTEIRNSLQEMEDREKTGKKWRQSVLYYMLTNPYYTGDYITGKTCFRETGTGKKRVVNKGCEEQYYIEEHHEPLVSREVFERVQVLIKRRILYTRKKHDTENEQRLMETEKD